MTPHKHADVIKAWADGELIEFRRCTEDPWESTGLCPQWYSTFQYRIKPKQVPDVTAFFYSGNVNREMANLGANVGVVNTSKSKANLMLIYDGKTGKLKSAEVI